MTGQETNHGVAVALSLLVLLTACNQPAPEGTGVDSCIVELAFHSGPPTTVIPVQGNMDLAGVRVLMVEPETWTTPMPLYSAAAEGESAVYGLVMPFHPESLLEGGPVALEISGPGLTPCRLDLAVEPLPDPDAVATRGAFLREIVALERAIHQEVFSLGVDPSVLTGDLGEVPEALVPFAFAQFLISHPENPQDVVDIIEQGHVVVDGEVHEIDVSLLDAVFALWATTVSSREAPLEAASVSGCELWANGRSLRPELGSLEQLEACLSLQSQAVEKFAGYDLAVKELKLVSLSLALTPLTVLNWGLLPVGLSLMSEGTVWQAKATLLPDAFAIDFGLSVSKLRVGEVGLLTTASFRPTGSEAFDIAPFIAAWITAFVPSGNLGPVGRGLKWLAEEAVGNAVDAMGFESAGPYTWSPLSLSGSDLMNPRYAHLIVHGDAVEIEVFEGRSYLGEVSAIAVGKARIEICPGGEFVMAATGALPCRSLEMETDDLPERLIGTVTWSHQFTSRYTQEAYYESPCEWAGEDSSVDTIYQISVDSTLRVALIRDTDGYRVSEVLDGNYYRREERFNNKLSHPTEVIEVELISVGDLEQRQSPYSPIGGGGREGDTGRGIAVTTTVDGVFYWFDFWFQGEFRHKLDRWYRPDCDGVWHHYPWDDETTERRRDSGWALPCDELGEGILNVGGRYDFGELFRWTCDVAPDPMTPLGFEYMSDRGFVGQYTYDARNETSTCWICNTTEHVIGTVEWDFIEQ